MKDAAYPTTHLLRPDRCEVLFVWPAEGERLAIAQAAGVLVILHECDRERVRDFAGIDARPLSESALRDATPLRDAKGGKHGN